MIVGTFREMPGMAVHLPQAARLLGLRVSTCKRMLDELVRVGALRRAPNGMYANT
jgi:DNA-binding IclR family transcriptional regulator